VPATNRDARAAPSKDGTELRPARKFSKYVDYNFSAMTDTKGGFLSTEDDPWNKSMSTGAAPSGAAPRADQKPAHMTAAEWERMQMIRKLQRSQDGPFAPSLSALADEKTRKRCRECRSVEIDFVWEEVFGCAVCNACKEKYPEKYSLLTKTECKEDYLLTDRKCIRISKHHAYSSADRPPQPSLKTMNSSRISPGQTRTSRTGTT
jgi:DNA-repair protein complementing XP-A cells